MILAAGLGKRMQPLTLKTPKPLLEINNISLLERAINLLIKSGVEEISINVHHLPEQIEKFIREKNFKLLSMPYNSLLAIKSFQILFIENTFEFSEVKKLLFII